MKSKMKVRRTAPKRGTQRMGRGGSSSRPMWLPDTESPPWLDGTMIGDRGFDPLGLAKPQEFLQVGIDQNEQNNAVNKAGDVVGTFRTDVDKVSGDSLSPYSEAFGIKRFRECELIHGRWCMLATLGVLVGETFSGVSWVDAGKVELAQTQYFNLDLPFSLTQVSWAEAILVGWAEVLRNTERDTTKRCYPGGPFDPLGLAAADKDAEQVTFLKEAELKHGRLAMVAFFGFGAQALAFGDGALGSLTRFSNSY